MRPRVIETNEGIQDQLSVEDYDSMMRSLRDRGMMETRSLMKIRIDPGEALEIGPGPGYLGLEWLSRSSGSRLTGLEISANMIKAAERNAAEYGLLDRVRYVSGDARELPFEDGSFDLVFTNGSLHEWAEPLKVFTEIHRVLRNGGRYWISDLRRDMSFVIRRLMVAMTRLKRMKEGLVSSINAAYAPAEIKKLISGTPLEGSTVKGNPFGLEISGSKDPLAPDVPEAEQE